MTKKVLFFNKDNEKVWKVCTICGLAKEINIYENKIQYLEKEIKYLNRKVIING